MAANIASSGLARNSPATSATTTRNRITFDSPELTEDMEIVGQPAVDLHFTSDKPVAHVAVRLQ